MLSRPSIETVCTSHDRFSTPCLPCYHPLGIHTPGAVMRCSPDKLRSAGQLTRRLHASLFAGLHKTARDGSVYDWFQRHGGIRIVIQAGDGAEMPEDIADAFTMTIESPLSKVSPSTAPDPHTSSTLSSAAPSSEEHSSSQSLTPPDNATRKVIVRGTGRVFSSLKEQALSGSSSSSSFATKKTVRLLRDETGVQSTTSVTLNDSFSQPMTTSTSSPAPSRKRTRSSSQGATASSSSPAPSTLSNCPTCHAPRFPPTSTTGAGGAAAKPRARRLATASATESLPTTTPTPRRARVPSAAALAKALVGGGSLEPVPQGAFPPQLAPRTRTRSAPRRLSSSAAVHPLPSAEGGGSGRSSASEDERGSGAALQPTGAEKKARKPRTSSKTPPSSSTPHSSRGRGWHLTEEAQREMEKDGTEVSPSQPSRHRRTRRSESRGDHPA